MNRKLIILILIVPLSNCFGQDLPLNRNRHPFSFTTGIISEKKSEKHSSDVVLNPDYIFPTYNYPSGNYKGYWVEKAEIKNDSPENIGFEIKMQYAYTHGKLYFTSGVNLSFWRLNFNGGYQRNRYNIKMPEPFKKEIYGVNHSYIYEDITTYLKIPIGFGINTRFSHDKFRLIPILSINPEFKIGEKVLKNEIIHHYLFHSDEFDWAGVHYDAYHQEDIVLENVLKGPLLFNMSKAGFFLNPAVSLIIEYQINKQLGIQGVFEYKFVKTYRNKFDSYFKYVQSIGGNIGIFYSI